MADGAMTDRTSSLQDEFFNRARKDGGQVTIFLNNGKKLSGRIRSFDKFTILVDVNRVEQMIFKHAISTVMLSRPSSAGPRPTGEPAPHASSAPVPSDPAEDVEEDEG